MFRSYVESNEHTELTRQTETDYREQADSSGRGLSSRKDTELVNTDKRTVIIRGRVGADRRGCKGDKW